MLGGAWGAAAVTTASTPPAGGDARAGAVPATEAVDDLGRRVRFDTPPQRIVSLLPSLTESVCALGACARVVGVDRFSNWPARVESLPRLGGLGDTPLERLAALQPDLVLLPQAARIGPRLTALGIPYLVFEPQTRAGLRTSLEQLGRALGGEAPGAARHLWATIEAGLAEARAAVPPADRGRSVYFEVSRAGHAAGTASFIGETLADLGLRNIVPVAQGAFPLLSPEFVLRADPDWIMSVEGGRPDWTGRPGWAGLRSIREDHVCAFGPGEVDTLVRAGPRLVEGARAVVACLQGPADRSSPPSSARPPTEPSEAPEDGRSRRDPAAQRGGHAR